MGTFEPDEFILHQENAFATDFLGCNGAGLVCKGDGRQYLQIKFLDVYFRESVDMPA